MSFRDMLTGTAGWVAKTSKTAVGHTGAMGGLAMSLAKKVRGTSRDAAVVATGTVAANAAVVPALGCIGFTAAGPAAGTVAASWMSLYGGAVSAGSWYALAQSVAMGGTAVGFTVPAAAVAASYFGSKAIYNRYKR